MPALLVALAVDGALGLVFERFIIRPVYGMHLKQILITMGGMIIGEEMIKVIWGPEQIALPLPEALRGSLLLGDASVERYRIMAVLVGAAVFAAMVWTLNRTKVGLLIRAGVQDREMVESLGYRIHRLFVGVFVAGSALAAGVLLCASSPAQGGPVYPASYPGVFRLTGDARCAPGQWSWLGTRQADFGGYVGAGGRAGASLGCAALSGRIAALLRDEPGRDRQQVHDWLRDHAAFIGPERRGPSHG